MTIKSKAPRWYQWKDGVITPCYELKKRSGNGMKAYSLREARELNLLPSVTSVLQVIDKPELDNWRVSQAIHSALTLPRPEQDFESWAAMMWAILDKKGLIGKSNTNDILEQAFHNPPGFTVEEDQWAKMVLEDSEAQAARAAELGTQIHNAIAKWIETGIAERDVDTFPYIEYLIKWADDNIEEVHAVEKTVGHPSIGVAGRMDLDCTLKGVGRTIIDFKTSAVKDGKPAYWPDWAPQLSAYAELVPNRPIWNEIPTPPRIMSIVIPSNEPGPVYPKLWTEEEQLDGWKVFQAAMTIWVINRAKGYDPRQP